MKIIYHRNLKQYTEDFIINIIHMYNLYHRINFANCLKIARLLQIVVTAHEKAFKFFFMLQKNGLQKLVQRFLHLILCKSASQHYVLIVYFN